MPVFRKLRQFFAGRRAFPEHYEQLLQQYVRFYRKLNSRQRQQLQHRMKIFMDEKIFEGCGGLLLTDDMKVIISAYACILILEEPSDYYPNLRSILIYPDDYIAPVYEESSSGIVTEGSEMRKGESWDNGSVVLSWADILKTTQSEKNNQNLVVHEFAHQLDQQYGLSAGISLNGDLLEKGDEWTNELAKTYRHLLTSAQFGRTKTGLDHYGATNPSECFAVVMETFVEAPRELEISHPHLYRMLTEFFNIDPGRW